MQTINKQSTIAIVGAGMTGLAIARMTTESGGRAVVYESAPRPGGLVKCETVEGNLYHLTGGHVFNSKRADVLEWFWRHFDKEADFIPARRNAVTSLEDGQLVGYPIENHLYQFDAATRNTIIRELLDIARAGEGQPRTLGEFFDTRFGPTLNRVYFAPYNTKIWGRDISGLPLEWLQGKLPMPTIEEIFENNIGGVDETKMVHSSFYYAKKGGSQFLADTLAKGLDIRCSSPVTRLEHTAEGKWLVEGETYDAVVYTGDIRQLPGALGAQHPLNGMAAEISALGFHGTTSVLCRIDDNPYSWIYMPSLKHGSHRIICTGNFSKGNNAPGITTGTIEFSRKMEREEIEAELRKIPFHPQYIAHHWEELTYPMQDAASRDVIRRAKEILAPQGLHLLGRFAEWEYYNMDAAIGACLDFMNTER